MCQNYTACKSFDYHTKQSECGEHRKRCYLKQLPLEGNIIIDGGCTKGVMSGPPSCGEEGRDFPTSISVVD